MVEQTQKFLDEADQFIGEGASRVGQKICSGLQHFKPRLEHYDVIWCQWVLGHLTDEHLVDFLKRAKTGLAENGIICVKENIAKSGVVFDDQDSSVTRSKAQLKKIFALAGLTILKEADQKRFPLGLFAVRMYALR
nr:N-terminal Xaa-Pro-Lys N-methyltransferase 1-like [Lytechinus pictus]